MCRADAIEPGARVRDMTINVVCPFCMGDLGRGTAESIECKSCGRVFPVRSGIPVLLSADEYGECLAEFSAKSRVWEHYFRVRRNSALTVMYCDWWVTQMMAELPRGLRGPLLEVMCGAGEISRRFTDTVGPSVALDLNVFQVERAAQELAAVGDRRVRFVCGTVRRLPFRDASVPLIMIQGGLHHVRRILREALLELARVLAPGGMLIASEPANDHWLIRAIRKWQYASSSQQGEDEYEDGFTRAEIESSLLEVGLHLRNYRLFGFVAYPLMGNSDLLPLFAGCRCAWLGRALLSLDMALERVPIVRRLAFANIFSAAKDSF